MMDDDVLRELTLKKVSNEIGISFETLMNKLWKSIDNDNKSFLEQANNDTNNNQNYNSDDDSNNFIIKNSYKKVYTPKKRNIITNNNAQPLQKK